MAEERGGVEGRLPDAGRRALLKAATVAGGAAAASALLPGSWKKPVATLGGLPAHAQTSQTITLARPQALYLSGGSVGVTPLEVEARCRYEDVLGEFGENHQLTVTFTPATKSVARESVSCDVPLTYTLGDLPNKIIGDKSAGELRFLLNTSCLSAGWMAWYVHKGDHVSNVVNASIQFGA